MKQRSFLFLLLPILILLSPPLPIPFTLSSPSHQARSFRQPPLFRIVTKPRGNTVVERVTESLQLISMRISNHNHLDDNGRLLDCLAPPLFLPFIAIFQQPLLGSPPLQIRGPTMIRERRGRRASERQKRSKREDRTQSWQRN